MSSPIQRPVRERVICGVKYQVTLLGAKQGRAMLVRLVKTLGPAVAAFLEGVLNAKGGLDVSLALGSAEALRDFIDKLNDKDIADISDQLAHFTVVVLSPELQPQLDAVLDDHFAGNYQAYSQWLAFALEANFASFFGGSSVGANAMLAKLKIYIRSLSASPTESTGTSTASQAVNTTAAA